MGFDSGSLRFSRFIVPADVDRTINAELFDRFRALALDQDYESTSELDYGWSAGRHVFDADFSPGNCVYAECVHVGFRLDTNKVPAEIKRAYVALEEKGDEPADRKARRKAKEAAGQRIEQDLLSGKYRRSRMTPVLWDTDHSRLYAAVSSQKREQLQELFERTHGVKPEPLTPGLLARIHLEARGLSRAYEELRPTKFFNGQHPNEPAEYPWAPKGENAKDWLGNEFVMWLWAMSFESEITLGRRGIVVAFDRSLDLDCVFGDSGKAGLRFERPTEMAEARDALMSGKVVRKAAIVLGFEGGLYSLSLNADDLSVSGLKLPEVPDAASPRVLFEERIGLLRSFAATLDGLFTAFIDLRVTSDWHQLVDRFRERFGKRNAERSRLLTDVVHDRQHDDRASQRDNERAEVAERA